MTSRPINLTTIKQEWETTNPENEALPQGIQDIVAQRITNSANSLQLIDRVKADHQEQRHNISKKKLVLFLLIPFLPPK